jgi:transposase-like protein
MTTNTNRSVFCPACSARCIRWGFNRSATVRYRCISCSKTITASQTHIGKRDSLLRWFEQYVREGLTALTVCRISKLSLSTLHRAFDGFLNQNPPTLSLSQKESERSYLILDGKWFGKRSCLMLYRESQNKLIIYYSFMKKEWGSLIAKDLTYLKEQGYHFTGVVSDGGTGIRKAVQTVYGHIPHQICMAHIHRQAVNAIGRRPKDLRAKELKLLADHIWKIESHEARRWWRKELERWYKTNWMFLNERREDTQGRKWYAHPGIRKAFRTLLNASDECFVFLTHHLMPKTTNELEGSIGNLSAKHTIHRGLTREKVPSFIRWFIYFYNRNLLSQRK